MISQAIHLSHVIQLDKRDHSKHSVYQKVLGKDIVIEGLNHFVDYENEILSTLLLVLLMKKIWNLAIMIKIKQMLYSNLVP